MIEQSKPETYTPAKSKTEEWYLKKVRDIVKIYNEQSHTNIFGESVDMVETYLKYYRYYYGKQENVDYAFMEQIAPGINTPANWLPGQKIASLVDYMRNTAIDQIKGYNVVAKAVGKDTVKKRAELFQKAEIELELRPVFDKMAQATGIPYQPIQGFRPNSKADIEKFKNTNYKENAAKACATLAKNAMYSNHYRELLPRVFFDALMTGIGVMKVSGVNGHPKWRVINPIYAIVDRHAESDVNRGARFAGEVRWLTLNQILTEYDLTKEQSDRLKETAQSDKWQEYNSDTKYPWWRMIAGEKLIKVVDVEWIDIKDIRFESNTDEYGNQHYVSTKRKNLSKKDREVKKKELIKKPVEVVRQAKLIGDCEMVDWGERTNQVRSMANLSETELSYQIFTPGMILGQNVSVAQRLIEHQDRIDLYRYKIQEAIRNDKGRKFTYDRSQLAEGEELEDVIIRMQTNSLIDYDSTASEDQRPPSGKYIDNIDLGLDDKTVMSYIALIQQEKLEMEEIVSIPKIAQGMQTNLVGKGVQENTIARATIGTLHYYESFLAWVNKVLLYSANVAKILYTREGEYEGSFVVGDHEHEFLKITKDMLFEDFTVYVDVSDKMDEQARNRILSIALAQAQNGMIDMLDYITMEKSVSYSEALHYWEQSILKKKTEDQQKMMMQLQAQQQIAQQRAEATKESQLMNQIGQNNRETLRTKGAIIQEGMRQGGIAE